MVVVREIHEESQTEINFFIPGYKYGVWRQGLLNVSLIELVSAFLDLRLQFQLFDFY